MELVSVWSLYWMKIPEKPPNLGLFLCFAAGMVKHITGGYKITYHPDGPEGQAWEVDFTPPFRRLSMTHDLEKIMGVKFPPTDSYNSDGKGELKATCFSPVFYAFTVSCSLHFSRDPQVLWQPVCWERSGMSPTQNHRPPLGQGAWMSPSRVRFCAFFYVNYVLFQGLMLPHSWLESSWRKLVSAPRSYATTLKLWVLWPNGEMLTSRLPRGHGWPHTSSFFNSRHRSEKGLTERFELFVMKKEICNSYTELNDSVKQRELFEQQAKVKPILTNISFWLP